MRSYGKSKKQVLKTAWSPDDGWLMYNPILWEWEPFEIDKYRKYHGEKGWKKNF